MPVDPIKPLAELCDEILLRHLQPGMRDQVARLHEKGIPRASMTRLLKQVGGTPYLILACEAEWDRLEKVRLQRE